MEAERGREGAGEAEAVEEGVERDDVVGEAALEDGAEDGEGEGEVAEVAEAIDEDGEGDVAGGLHLRAEGNGGAEPLRPRQGPQEAGGACRRGGTCG